MNREGARSADVPARCGAEQRVLTGGECGWGYALSTSGFGAISNCGGRCMNGTTLLAVFVAGDLRRYQTTTRVGTPFMGGTTSFRWTT